MAQYSFAILNTTTVGLPANTIVAQAIDLTDIARLIRAAQATRYRLDNLTNAQAARQLFLDAIKDMISMALDYERVHVVSPPAPIGTTTTG